jgi:hypothetical protein
MGVEESMREFGDEILRECAAFADGFNRGQRARYLRDNLHARRQAEILEIQRKLFGPVTIHDQIRGLYGR